jgi:CRP-like cAMP-binding protein
MSETIESRARRADAPRNRLLSELPASELESLLPFLEPVRLPQKTVLFEPLQPIEHVYFIEEGVASIVSLMSDLSSVEVATVGPEGMVGIPVYLGGISSPGQAFMQVPGSALRMRSRVLREELRRGAALSDMLGRYTQAMLTMISQASACNRLHSIDRRCARWLLATHDRVRGDTFDLTQLFLAQMLGVRRASVNEAATRLQDQGLIEYTRGRITVCDRPGLEAAACECYRIVSSEFDRLLGETPTVPPFAGKEFSHAGRTLAADADGAA